MIAFSVLLILRTPLISIYNSYRHKEFYTGLSKFTIGNMGFSETNCAIDSVVEATYVDDPLVKEQRGFDLMCEAGVISELLDFGITT